MDVHPKILVVSANLGDFDKPVEHVKQSIDCDFFTFTDENFPPRKNAMTPRLQARIPKMFAWQMKPGYDYYLWIDSSCRLAHKDAVKYFLDKLGDKDIAVLKHPNRDTVREEANYIQQRLDINCPYITPRYEGERLWDQVGAVDGEAPLYASTVFIYKNDTPARDALTIWWLHTSLYHTVDQLALHHAIEAGGASHKVINKNYMKMKEIEYVRNR